MKLPVFELLVVDDEVADAVAQLAAVETRKAGSQFQIPDSSQLCAL